MGVGGVRGGGGKGGVKGPSGSAPSAKTEGPGFKGKVGEAAPAEAASGAAPSSGVAAPDPVTLQALELARKLRSGEISSKEEATKQLVADILKEKLRMQSEGLTSRIADALQDDPRLNQALDRLWSKEE